MELLVKRYNAENTFMEEIVVMGNYQIDYGAYFYRNKEVMVRQTLPILTDF